MEEKLKLFDENYPIDFEQIVNVNNSNTGLLFSACQHGNLRELKQIFEFISNYNIQDNTLKLNLNLNIKNRDGLTPLYIASQNGYLEIVRELIQQGANVDLCGVENATPLIVASFSGHLEIVQELLQHQANVNCKTNSGYTALHEACLFGNLSVVQELLKHNPDVNAMLNDGTTPLFLACQNGHADVAQVLLQYGANIDFAKLDTDANLLITPLSIAAQNGHIDVIQVLLQFINTVNNDSYTPLHVFCIYGQVNAVKELLELNPNIDSTTNDGRTALLMACGSNATYGNHDLFKLLIKNGAALTHKNTSNQTALDIAFIKNNEAAITELLTAAHKNSFSDDTIMSPETIPLAMAWKKAHPELFKKRQANTVLFSPNLGNERPSKKTKTENTENTENIEFKQFKQ